jgi:hypothetical protein
MITYVIILIVVILTGIPAIYFVNKKPQLRIPLMVTYAIIGIILAYLLVANINRPIDFKKETKIRHEAAKEKLMDIRTVQVSYKDKYGKYTGSFDTLIHFVKTDSFEIEDIREAVPGTWNQDEVSKSEALKSGILVKKSSFVPVSDSLWKSKKYEIDNIRYIPYTDGEEFTLGAGEIETASKVKVKVFECYARYNVLYNGMDEQLIVNYIDEKTKYGGFDGIRVGSLIETTNNAGNWEE